jgi:predicted HicB family RNase H-like nuclease
VRLTPALHRKATTKAAMEGISLNQLIQKAVEEKVQT